MTRLPDLERPLRRTATNRSQTADVNVAFLDFPLWILAAFPVPIAVAGMGVDVQAPPPALHVDSGVTS